MILRVDHHPLGTDTLLHVKAAECWLALGQIEEATREIRSIPLRARRHPDVRKVSVNIDRARRDVRAIIRNHQILQPLGSRFGHGQMC